MRVAGPWSDAARRLAAAALALVLAAASGVLGASGVSADEETPTPASTPMGPPLSASLVSIAPAYLSPSTSLSVRVAVTAGSNPLSGVQTIVSVTEAPLATANAVDAFLAEPNRLVVREVGRGQPAEFLQGVPRVPGSLDAGSAATTSLLISPGSLAMPRHTSGVYGVTVTTVADGVMPVTNAFVMTWTDSTVPRMDVAVLASIGGGPERADALLTAARDDRIALAIDGSVLPLIDPELADLDGREAYALPAGNLDISSVAHASAGSLIDFALTRSRGAASELPWLAVPGTLDQAVVDAVAAHGAAGILAGTKLEYGRPEAAGSVAEAVATSGETMPVAMADRRLSDLLASSPTTDPAAPSRLVAETALMALDPAPQGRAAPVLIAPGESWIVDGTRGSDELAALFGAPWVRPASVADVLAATANVVPLAELAPVTRDVAPETVVAAQQLITRVGDLAAATDQPGLLLDAQGRALLSALSLQLRSDTDAREQALTTAMDDVRAALAGVRVTSSSELTLVSSSGKVPITVRNDLSSHVTVVVVMTSRSPRLLIDEQPVATLPPGSEQTVFVPITAVSSGNVLVTVALRSEDGATLAVAQTLKVRVRAEWGNVATGVATVALMVLLVAGVWRTIRRGRRDTRVGPLSEDSQFDADARAAR